ncbi:MULTISPECIES: MFS transporter [unclassified Pseudomonas]|uniref:MFS transporter n=1 Tax=unclassified Pseudomonas TaxID=196821 RepID=UPI000BDA2DEC|nr:MULTISPECIES: MFS transporter [unclassified Pseudomonas]PVZ10437.1 sugar phosphate permease [Pseudomonas sp. URIL14HWK12:I12]PVZ21863.1 sugar phosphate permease [Pseudomonas sp. URIL14HWK12:I10]PVZ31054.1 sugar phosphate permease [Pseudomonas sp. URIL14HWK12:I11]SNZ17657.1 Sugar phosphate permease [Pseudomonas sp. URIL14HWK12:I9]
MFTHYRWRIAALLFGAGMLNYLDRAALSVVAPMVKQDLGIDDLHMGFIFSSFFIGYCALCFIGGWAADRFGPRRVFTWAAGTWSLFCGLTATITGYAQLLVYRVMFGMGEGPMGTTTNKAITHWFPREEAGRAIGLTNCGQPLGAALAAPVVGLVALQYGWRVSFVVIAALGLVWLAAWLRWFRDHPADHPSVSAAERELIENSRARAVTEEAEDTDRGLAHYIFSVPVLAVAMAFFCFNYVLYFFLTWLPSYLMDAQHLDVKSMSIVGTIPWLGAAVGFLGGGIVTDWLGRRLNNVIVARKVMLTLGLGVAALCVLLVNQVSSLSAAVACITVSSVFLFVTPQICWALIQDIVPKNRVGGTGGFVHLLANLAGIASPSITGMLVQLGGGYASAFLAAALVAGVGMLVVLLAVRARGRAMPAPAAQH